MEVIREPTPIKPATQKALQKRLVADPMAYTESVGRRDKKMTAEVLSNESGEGTVLRLFFGATACMPLRGLSYVAAAQAIAEHIPHEQLQVIFANSLGQTTNGLGIETSRSQAMLVRDSMRRKMEVQGSDSAERIVFAEDHELDSIDAITPDISNLIVADQSLHEKLHAKGLKRGSDHVRYGAAHVTHQETNLLEPQALSNNEPAVVTAQRIISIGCQQEHVFYALRHLARQALTDLPLVPTAQIFTRHVLPPYFMARGGEQSLSDALEHGIDMMQMQDSSARRDVAYLLEASTSNGVAL